MLEREDVDAIISDILMPRMDGYRLCQEVRKSERWREMPFIFYTATYTSPGDEQLCHDLGGDKYLRKPFEKKALLAALSEATDAARRRPRHRAALPSESDVMKEYSERLVCKLDKKLQELEEARAALQQANLELESRVQQRTAELNAANQELESFSYSVSHDLRAPLRHISGYIDILLRDCGGQLNETHLKHLQAVHAAARTMGELIDALLQLSRVTRAEIHRRPVDLSALAAEVLAELQQSDPNRVVKLEITPGLNANGDEGCSASSWPICSATPGSIPGSGPTPGLSLAKSPAGRWRPISCAITGPALTWLAPASSSAHFNACMALMNSRALASDWRRCSASSAGTTEQSGPRASAIRGRHSILRWMAAIQKQAHDPFTS